MLIKCPAAFKKQELFSDPRIFTFSHYVDWLFGETKVTDDGQVSQGWNEFDCELGGKWILKAIVSYILLLLASHLLQIQ